MIEGCLGDCEGRSLEIGDTQFMNLILQGKPLPDPAMYGEQVLAKCLDFLNEN
jgi:hypothetical protein